MARRGQRNTDPAGRHRELAEAILAHGWTVEREITTLISLARCNDPVVAVRALDALHTILRARRDRHLQENKADFAGACGVVRTE